MIKSLAIAAMLMLSPAVSYAVTAAADVCDSLGSLATTIMEVRQQGVSSSVLLAITETADIDTQEMVKTIIMQAYEQPIYEDVQLQKMAIDNFSTIVLLACYEAIN